MATIVYRHCDVSYNCNNPVSQLECSFLNFIRNSVLFILFFVKIKAFWLRGKIWGFVLQQIGYLKLLYWQQHLEVLFCLHFMRVYRFYYQTTYKMCAHGNMFYEISVLFNKTIGTGVFICKSKYWRLINCVVRYACMSSEMMLCERSQICAICIICTNILHQKVLIEFFSIEFNDSYWNSF